MRGAESRCRRAVFVTTSVRSYPASAQRAAVGGGSSDGSSLLLSDLAGAVTTSRRRARRQPLTRWDTAFSLSVTPEIWNAVLLTLAAPASSSLGFTGNLHQSRV